MFLMNPHLRGPEAEHCLAQPSVPPPSQVKHSPPPDPLPTPHSPPADTALRKDELSSCTEGRVGGQQTEKPLTDPQTERRIAHMLLASLRYTRAEPCSKLRAGPKDLASVRRRRVHVVPRDERQHERTHVVILRLRREPERRLQVLSDSPVSQTRECEETRAWI